jgi:hypothetical protein
MWLELPRKAEVSSKPDRVPEYKRDVPPAAPAMSHLVSDSTGARA